VIEKSRKPFMTRFVSKKINYIEIGKQKQRYINSLEFPPSSALHALTAVFVAFFKTPSDRNPVAVGPWIKWGWGTSFDNQRILPTSALLNFIYVSRQHLAETSSICH
jgi:hypothetical protein